MNWKDQAARAVVPTSAPVLTLTGDAVIAAALRQRLPALGRDADFAASLLAGFARYGSFTERQRPHAQRLAAAPELTAQPTSPPPPAQPKAAALAALLAPGSGFARLRIAQLTISAKRDFSCAWVKWDGQLVARLSLPDGTIHGLPRHASPDMIAATVRALAAIEADPKAALEIHGQTTGRCGCCGLLLTDPVSVARGIGPICASRF